MIKTQQDQITLASFTRSPLKKIVRKRSSVSSTFSDKSDSSLKNFKFVRLNKNLHSSNVQQSQDKIIFDKSRLSQLVRPTNSQQNPQFQKVKLSVSTYESSFISKKKIFERQPLNSKQKQRIQIQKPLTDRLISKNFHVDSQRIQLQTQFIQQKNKQFKSLENQKLKLIKLNQNLQKRNQCLQQQNQTLKAYILSLKKRTQQSQNMLKHITSLDEVTIQGIHSIQRQRQIYLQKQLKQLRNTILLNKGNNQKLLQIELDSYKRQIYQANKIIQALKVNNNCLQIKLQQKVEISQYLVGQDSVRLKTLNKKLRSDILVIKQQYNTLRKQYEKILQQRLFMDNSFSLQYSNFV